MQGHSNFTAVGCQCLSLDFSGGLWPRFAWCRPGALLLRALRAEEAPEKGETPELPAPPSKLCLLRACIWSGVGAEG